jgi:hypothetical protein
MAAQVFCTTFSGAAQAALAAENPVFMLKIGQ